MPNSTTNDNLNKSRKNRYNRHRGITRGTSGRNGSLLNRQQSMKSILKKRVQEEQEDHTGSTRSISSHSSISNDVNDIFVIQRARNVRLERKEEAKVKETAKSSIATIPDCNNNLSNRGSCSNGSTTSRSRSRSSSRQRSSGRSTQSNISKTILRSNSVRSKSNSGLEEKKEEIIIKRRRTVDLDSFDDEWSENINSNNGNCCVIDNNNDMEEKITSRRISSVVTVQAFFRGCIDRMKYQQLVRRKYVEDMEQRKNKKIISLNNHRFAESAQHRFDSVTPYSHTPQRFKLTKSLSRSSIRVEVPPQRRQLTRSLSVMSFRENDNSSSSNNNKSLGLLLSQTNNSRDEGCFHHVNATERPQLQKSLSATPCRDNNNNNKNLLPSLLSRDEGCFNDDNRTNRPQLKRFLSRSSIRVDVPQRGQLTRSLSVMSLRDIKSNKNNNKSLASFLKTTNGSRDEGSFNDDNATINTSINTSSFQYLQEKKNRLLQLQETGIDIERKKCLELQQIEQTKQLQLQKLTEEYNEYKNDKIRKWQQRQQEKNDAIYSPLEENPQELIDCMNIAYELIGNLKKANEQLKHQKEQMENVLAQYRLKLKE